MENDQKNKTRKEIDQNQAMQDSLVDRLQSSGPKRILALDGGGIRGALCLGFLEKIEGILAKRYDNPDFRLSDYYDMIGGTSTGAIIAGGLAKGMRVSEVTQLYLEMGSTIFSERVNPFGSFLQTISNRARFKVNRLESALYDQFEDITLGSDQLKTGLCIIAKRADNFRPYIFHNHPHSTFYSENKGILIRDLLRATSAAPSYFKPKLLNLGGNNKGVFIDGGVSSYNNPGLILFYICTLSHLPYGWITGKDNLLITSVGTGFSRPKKEVKKVLRRRIISWAKDIPDLFMTDATNLNQLVLQSMGYSLLPQKIDPEMGDLSGVNVVRDHLFSYQRYNVPLDKNTLQHYMKRSFDLKEIEHLIEMSNGENAQKLNEIGKTFAKILIESNHFSSSFDMLYEHKKEILLTQDDREAICKWIVEKGHHYKKFKLIHARVAARKEKITSTTTSGRETINMAEPGDFIVKNLTSSEEQYVLKPDQFRKRYDHCRRIDHDWDEYAPKGEVHGIQLTEAIIFDRDWPKHFYILPAWNNMQYCTVDDYLVCPPDSSEFYRIGRREFEETYTLKKT